jgi:hypothetical protein
MVMVQGDKCLLRSCSCHSCCHSYRIDCTLPPLLLLLVLGFAVPAVVVSPMRWMRYSRLFARFIIIVVRRPTTTGGAASLVCRIMISFVILWLLLLRAKRLHVRPCANEKKERALLLCVEGMDYHRRRYHCHDILPSRSKSGDSCVPPETKRIRMMPGDK